jgi:hypothetical protein
MWISDPAISLLSHCGDMHYKAIAEAQVLSALSMFIKVSSYYGVSSLAARPRRWDLSCQIWLWWLLGAVVLCCASSYSRSAEFDAANNQTIVFDIPSEPLASALQDFSQRSGIELFYESAITDGLESTPLKGAYTSRDALRRLLSGTGFIVHYNLHNAVSLSLPTMADPSLEQDHSLGAASLSLGALNVVAGAPDGEQLQEFAEALQNDVSTALTKNPDVRSGNYRIRIKLWIDPSRAIRRAVVTQTTGDAARDAAIATVLQGLVITRAPPLGLAQPVRVIVAVDSP